MLLLQYHARPKAKPINADDIAGAFINCWINDDNQKGAEQKAMKMMDENGWAELTLDEVSFVTRSDYEDDEQLQYFDQALIDDEVLVVYTYPLVDREAD